MSKARARDLAALAASHARAAGRLLASSADVARSVHLSRRHIKRARSLLRALKPLAPAAAARENARLRAIAHQLAPLRDAHALEEAARMVGAAALAAEEPGRVDLASLGRDLVRRGRTISRLAALEAPKSYIATAVRRAYAKARRCYAAYAAAPASEPMHEARKRIKDCLHLIEALDGQGLAKAVPKARDLDEVAELMGSIRDLDFLAGRIRRDEAGEAKRLRIAARRVRLERALTRTAEKVFAIKPKRVERAWKKAA